MELRKVDNSNIWKIVELSVKEDQQHFVATNTESLLEAYTAMASGSVALPFGLYEEDQLVGFVMFGYGSDGSEGEPEIAQGNYLLWRFMIDRKYQGQGLGRRAALACLDYLRTFPCGEAKYCWLSYEPDNNTARKLYNSLGFTENGEICYGEIVAVLPL